MPVKLALVLAPSPLWRVERTDPALRFSLLNPVDVMNDRAGNRFDIPGAGVLYGATTAEGGFAETLAGFRPRASMVGAFSQLTPEPGRVLPGQVPTAWLTTRRLRIFDVMGSLPFVDLESPTTHAYLTEHAPTVLLHQGLHNLDVAAIRGPNRLLTRAIASWLYSRTDEHAHPLYAGIRYVSRLGNFECWAIFDGTPVELRSSVPVDPTNPALRNVIELFGMTIP
ncbi:RES family NAD+ phosphorylase [Cryobacterium sp. Y11]|uniref:RES family NAD+ phosphorylase n=1 Tax=Cryobacterium sp. Y11 TaxID=2045016 RepID=UPI000CE38134|nr:RES family NAD+ phosphorylase [Cryobacterium sp. Y11]